MLRLRMLEQLRFADGQPPVEGGVSRQKLEMAAKPIESYRAPGGPEKHWDSYRAELSPLIEAKPNGQALPTAGEIQGRKRSPPA